MLTRAVLHPRNATAIVVAGSNVVVVRPRPEVVLMRRDAIVDCVEEAMALVVAEVRVQAHCPFSAVHFVTAVPELCGHNAHTKAAIELANGWGGGLMRSDGKQRDPKSVVRTME